METALICFIILSNDETAYKNCIHYLDRLIVPVGMRVQYMRGEGYDGSNTASACQTAMNSSDAKYKIYMTDRVSVTNPRFLPTVISAFRADETLGILGVMGY
ncbi:MAG: glycosyltransferase family protein, partial [Selenomonadaceae bacterium]|nr:glycosyltransferase family protein [Selenomonadaceae bacterium]